MMGRPEAMLGDSIQAIEDAFHARYGTANPPAVVLNTDGSEDLSEDCAGERTIEIAIGPMEESPAINGSPYQPVEQIVEIVLKQHFDFPDPANIGEEMASAARRESRKEFLNFVGDVVGYCRFLSAPGVNEFAAVRYVQGGPIVVNEEFEKEFQWYIELAVPLSLHAVDSPAQARVTFGTYTGPVPANSINWRFFEAGEELRDEAQRVTR